MLTVIFILPVFQLPLKPFIKKSPSKGHSKRTYAPRYGVGDTLEEYENVPFRLRQSVRTL